MKCKLMSKILPVFLALFTVCLAAYVYNLHKKSISGAEKYTYSKPSPVTGDWRIKWDDSDYPAEGHFPWFSGDYSFESWERFDFPGNPKSLNTGNHRGVWITAVLPEGDWGAPTLRFRAPQQAVRIYVEGELIYTFGAMDFSNTKDTPGSIWHFVTLPKDSLGKRIFFRTYSPVVYLSGYLIEIEVGEKSDHILNILKREGKSLILGSLFIFIGLISILIMTSSLEIKKILLSFGFFSICIGTWSIAEGKLLQLFIDSPVIPVYVANLSIFLMPSGIISFVQQIFTEEGSFDSMLLKRMWQFCIALTVTVFTFDMLKLQSILNMDIYIHLMIAAAIPALLYVTTKAISKGNKDAFIFLFGLVALAVTGLIDIYVMFYLSAPLNNPRHISDLGMLVMILSLIGIIVRKLSLLNKQLIEISQENETNYKSLFNNMTGGFIYSRIIYDENNRPTDCVILDANPSFIADTGMSKEQIIGMKISEVLPELKKTGMKWIPDTGNETAACSEILTNEHLKYNDKWFKLSAFSPKDGYISILLSDITEMKNAESIIRRQAYNDSMTGFFNRTYFENVMLKAQSMIEVLKPVSIIVIDIDGLKITNDTFGHRAGDELLVEASKIISQVFADNCTISRVGGDEFCIILYNTDYESASAKRDLFVRLIEEANSNCSRKVPISMSIGLATLNEEENEDIFSVYRRADDDMYQYKLSQSGSEKSKLIDMLLTALAERDYVSQGHVERLVLMAECMADKMGLQDYQKRNLVLLAKVHDLGKIGISDKILFKSGKLSKEEYEIMKQHVRIGFNIANRSRELVNIATLILHHHEHWDGTGYPEGLSGNQIPLECRILAVIDAYDAMTSARPYHKGKTKKEALAEIKRCSGAQFDPVVVEHFIAFSETLL